MGAGGNLFEVGAADAAGVNANQHLAGADRWDRDSFQANIVYAAVDGGLHGRGNGSRVGFERILSSYGHEFILDDVGGWFVSNQWDGVD